MSTKSSLWLGTDEDGKVEIHIGCRVHAAAGKPGLRLTEFVMFGMRLRMDKGAGSALLDSSN